MRIHQLKFRVSHSVRQSLNNSVPQWVIDPRVGFLVSRRENVFGVKARAEHAVLKRTFVEVLQSFVNLGELHVLLVSEVTV
jgi:hypothetical protein